MKKRTPNISIAVKTYLLFLLSVILIPSCHVGRFIIYNFADIDDYKKFPSKKLNHSGTPFHFTSKAPTSSIALPKTLSKGMKLYPFTEGLKKTGTVAFAIIRNDTILYEWYAKNYGPSSIVTSFSIAKSFVSALIGIAIDEGYIKNTQEPITRYLNFLDKEKFGKITIQHLLDMRSGLKYSENYYSPFSDAAKYYYGNNIRKFVRRIKVKKDPGLEFEYVSVNTQLLGLILESATGKSPTDYLQEKIWEPVGMEYDGSWTIDSKKRHTEKAFVGLNARPFDFAKLGRLYLNKGNWQGKQIVSSKWVEESVTFSEPKNSFDYSNQWWHTIRWTDVKDTATVKKPYDFIEIKTKGSPRKYLIYPSGDFSAEGHLGQIVYVNPDKKLIGIRFGKTDGNVDWSYLFRDIAERRPITDTMVKKISIEKLKQLEGVYASTKESEKWEIQFTLVNGMLRGNDNGYRYNIIPTADNTFINPDDGATLVFDTQDLQNVTMTLMGKYKFRKVK